MTRQELQKMVLNRMSSIHSGGDNMYYIVIRDKMLMMSDDVWAALIRDYVKGDEVDLKGLIKSIRGRKKIR